MTRILIAAFLVAATLRPEAQGERSPALAPVIPVIGSELLGGAPRANVHPLGHRRAMTGGAPLPTISDAKAFALGVLGKRQFRCLSAIVQRESRWRVDAVNRRSGATGLGQALPASKMARFGADYLVNPVTQLKWAIHYASKYGGPCGAWAFWREHRWW